MGYYTQVVFREVFSCRLCMKITSFARAKINFIDFVCINCYWNEVRVNSNTNGETGNV